MSINIIYKTFFDLQQKYTLEFCKKVQKILNPTQTGEYIHRIYTDMEKELETVLETNKDYYDEWFSMEYNKLEQNMKKTTAFYQKEKYEMSNSYDENMNKFNGKII